jgi:hypothetical protein
MGGSGGDLVRDIRALPRAGPGVGGSLASQWGMAKRRMPVLM